MERSESEGHPFRILFVCTGNTCRSPMAEAIVRRELEDLGWLTSVEVESAGIGTVDGMPASAGALRAAERHGIDLSGHRSRLLTSAIVARADLVLTMSTRHLDRVLDLGAGDRATLLTAFGLESPGELAGVPDPFGGDDSVYEGTFQVLEDLVARSLRRLTSILSP